ncbi:LAME_0E08724g1_1 [Lachancea meyersii CBS 8951]|uniref:LAME_0E08724g1_1 n=1 Tax=Lachancea meyersii CBS 8951 TaxID=1266667 RepID=A0A1G4JJ19_9SACH|nr:LAME_0E08724g1_1 [Lachancea meyersii CBS 8951]
MLEDQLYVACCLLAAKADLSRVKKLILGQDRVEQVEILKIVCVLWPELDDPLQFIDILKSLEKSRINELGILESLVSGDRETMAVVESSPDILSERKRTLKQHVDYQLQKIAGISIESCNWQFTFLQARILICNAVVDDPLFYRPLFSRLSADQYPEFMKWVSGIIKPLAHFCNRSILQFSIAEFESLSTSKALTVLWESLEVVEESKFRGALNYEVLPFLAYVDGYNELLAVVFNAKNFPLDSISNFNRYKVLSFELVKMLPTKFKTAFQREAITILYENGDSLSKVQEIDLRAEHCLLLSSIEGNITLQNGLDVKTLKLYAQSMDLLHIFNLNDIHKLTQDSELVQKSFFSTMCKQSLGAHGSHIMLENVGTFVQSDPIFNKLDSNTKKLIIVESLLDGGHLDMLQQFAENSKIELEDNFLLSFFWRFFNSASNGRHNRPDMLNARRILELLPTDQYQHLADLLQITDKLSYYSLSFSKGIPFRPSVLLEFKSEPYEIISKLLELNNELYKRTEETFEILKQLYSGLQLKPTSPGFDDEYTRILALHIDFALANSDFEYAFAETKSLLERTGCDQFWSTILQVGKFFDPSWPNSEIPTEIIYLQLEILGSLLHICPEDEVEAVISQWSALESELSTRDLVEDQYSLLNGKPSEFKTKVIEEVSTSASNFLSGGTRWIMGAGL